MAAGSSRSNKTFKTMNRPLTILGAERRLFFVALVSGGAVFSMIHSLLGGLVLFIAGTMAANHSGLQMDTLRNLLLAWVLTLPVCVLLGAAVFAFGLNLVLRLGI